MNTERSPLFLMANLGSEVNRLLDFKERGEVAEIEKSQKRALQIVARILAMPQMQSRQSEITILKNLIEDLVLREGKYRINPEDLRQYFIPFATRLLQ